MKLPLFAVLLFPLSVSAVLQPGERFPEISLPSVRTGENVAFDTITGEKLMLHLFASW